MKRRCVDGTRTWRWGAVTALGFVMTVGLLGPATATATPPIGQRALDRARVTSKMAQVYQHVPKLRKKATFEAALWNAPHNLLQILNELAGLKDKDLIVGADERQLARCLLGPIQQDRFAAEQPFLDTLVRLAKETATQADQDAKRLRQSVDSAAEYARNRPVQDERYRQARYQENWGSIALVGAWATRGIFGNFAKTFGADARGPLLDQLAQALWGASPESQP